MPRPRASKLPLLALPYWVYVVGILGVPLVVLGLYSLWEPGFYSVTRNLTGSNYAGIVQTPVYMLVIVKSLAVGAIAAGCTCTLGFALAYAITFRLGRLGRPVLFAVALTLLASYVVRVYAWGTILGTNGLVNQALLSLHIIGHPLGFLFYGYFAIFLTLTYVYLPIATLVVYGGLQDIDPRTIESARDLGARRIRRLFQITLPQAMPAIKAAFALTFILTTTDYITPQIVGGFSGQMVGSLISDQFSQAANLPLGAALAFVTVVAIFASLLVLNYLAKAISRGSRSLSPLMRDLVAKRRDAVVLSRSSLFERLPLAQAGATAILAFLAAPLIIVIIFSFNRSPVPSIPFTGFTFRWYAQVVQTDGFGSALQNTLILMAVAVICSILLAVPVSFMLVRSRLRRATNAVLPAVYAPVVIPGVMMGIALLTSAVFLNVDLGLFVTALAHILIVTPYVIMVTRSRLLDMDIRIEEAARDLGARQLRVFSDITVALLRPSLIGAAVLAAAVSMDELLVTNFTIGAGATVPVWILGQIHRNLTPGINALAVMIFGSSIILIGITMTFLRGNLLSAISGAR